MQPQGYARDGLQVPGDLLTRESVAARAPPYQNPILIDEFNRQTIKLGLTAKGEFLIGCQPAPDSQVKGLEFLGVHGIVKAEQGDAVPHGGEVLQRWGANAPGGGIWRNEVGKGRFKLLESPQQHIVLSVRNLGRIEHIVAVIVVIDAADQFRNTFPGPYFVYGIHTHSSGISKIAVGRTPLLLAATWRFQGLPWDS